MKDCQNKLWKYPQSFFFISAYISTGQIMGWGNKAIEIRSAETGHLDGVFMHKKAQKLKFLCERNDKVGRCLLRKYFRKNREKIMPTEE